MEEVGCRRKPFAGGHQKRHRPHVRALPESAVQRHSGAACKALTSDKSQLYSREQDRPATATAIKLSHTQQAKQVIATYGFTSIFGSSKYDQTK